jgi:hypothetical protein
MRCALSLFRPKKVLGVGGLIWYQYRCPKFHNQEHQNCNNNDTTGIKFMKTMRKLSAILLAVAACSAWPVMAQPSATAPTTNAPAPARPKQNRFGGTVTSVDSANMVLSLKGRPGSPDNKVKITHDTKIKKDGEPGEFTDAVEGVRVNGSGKKGDDGVWTANTLNIVTKPPVRKTPPAAAPGQNPPQ